MADDKTFTQADIDKAIADAVGKVQESIDKLETKNEQLIGENRKLKRGAEIKPEDLTAAEERAEKAETALAAANKTVKTLTTERDNAVKSLETEQGAARTYALDAEIAAGIAEGGVMPAYAGAYRALLKEQKPEVELVDGKYVSKIGGKPIRQFITDDLAGDNGKHFKAAPVNGGGGAQGGSGGEGAKQVTRSAFDGMDAAGKMDFAKAGGKVVDA